MGCAPSIHVSQSGIVYCREEIRESSSGARASSSLTSEVINHIHTEPVTTAVTSTVRITRGRFPSIDKRKSVETDTQSFDFRKMEEISQVCMWKDAIIFCFIKSLTGGPATLFCIALQLSPFSWHPYVLNFTQTGRKKGIHVWTDEALSKPNFGKGFYISYWKRWQEPLDIWALSLFTARLFG